MRERERERGDVEEESRRKCVEGNLLVRSQQS